MKDLATKTLHSLRAHESRGRRLREEGSTLLVVLLLALVMAALCTTLLVRCILYESVHPVESFLHYCAEDPAQGLFENPVRLSEFLRIRQQSL